MVRYIDANALDKSLDEQLKRIQLTVTNDDIKLIAALLVNGIHLDIENTPTADVVERKRGKWETEIRTIRGHKIPFPVCSVCGKYTIYAYSYCPNCGAEMESK